MDSEVDNELPEGWVEEDDDLPEGWVEEETPRQDEEFPDYDPNLEFNGDYGVLGQLLKSGLSGATLGFSEKFDALKPAKPEETDNPLAYSAATASGEITGSLLPLSKMLNYTNKAAASLAAKSPVFKRQIGSLLNILGVGAVGGAHHGISKTLKGNEITSDEILEHGAWWSALDTGLRFLGVAGKGGAFAATVLRRAEQTGLPEKQTVNLMLGDLEKIGTDVTKVEDVAKSAMEWLKQPITDAEAQAAAQLARREATSKSAEAAEQALNPEPITPTDLKDRYISDEPLKRLGQEVRINAEEFDPATTTFEKEAKALEDGAVNEMSEKISPRAASKEELGDTIKETVESNLEKAKSEYRPLYTEVKEAAEGILSNPSKTAEVAGDKLLRISKLKTKPAGYPAVISNLENALKDIGYTIERDEAGEIAGIFKETDVSVSDQIELAIRLNEIVDYEAVEPTVKDTLKGVVRALKQDIRTGLAANPDTLAAFELAEQAHANTASKFSTPTMRKIRGQDAGEKIAKMAESPSTFAALKETLSQEVVKQVEREFLEDLQGKSFENAKKQYREMRSHISKEASDIAKQILEGKNPYNPLARKKAIQNSVLEDLSNAFTTGERPSKALNLWKTPKGQKIIRETFKGSPNWQPVKQYLEKQSFNDMVASVMKDGQIDVKSLKKFLKDPTSLSNIRAQGGKEAVQFFKSLESNIQNLERNVKLLERVPFESNVFKQKMLEAELRLASQKQITKTGQEALKTQRARAKESTGEKGKKILKESVEKSYPIKTRLQNARKWFTETMGINEKGIISVFGLMKLGLPNTVATMIGFRIMERMLTSARFRKAFKEASKYHANPQRFLLSIKKMGEALDNE